MRSAREIPSAPDTSAGRARAIVRITMRPLPVIAFVDIDGLPLPDPGSRGGHADLLAALARERIMIVFCARHTRAQVEGVRQAFGIFHPFVCENGAAAFVPERYFGSDLENARKVGGYQAVELGADHGTVNATLHRIADRLNLGVLAFSDMSVELVARECGLSLLDARLAKLREYSERFRLLCANPIAERRLFRALEAAGLNCRPGEAFHDVGSIAGPDSAIKVLATLYRVAFGRVLTIVQSDDAALVRSAAAGADLRLDGYTFDAADSSAGCGWLQWLLEGADKARSAQALAGPARLAR
jgi:predicted mannosyl-3-phosphoglycerate phosphatase (HAD superfamily)